MLDNSSWLLVKTNKWLYGTLGIRSYTDSQPLTVINVRQFLMVIGKKKQVAIGDSGHKVICIHMNNN
jgi:hypothetical protein